MTRRAAVARSPSRWDNCCEKTRSIKSTVVRSINLLLRRGWIQRLDAADATAATSIAWRGVRWTTKPPKCPRRPADGASHDFFAIRVNLEAACFYYGAGSSNGRPSSKADPLTATRRSFGFASGASRSIPSIAGAVQNWAGTNLNKLTSIAANEMSCACDRVRRRLEWCDAK
jgi:hypothetical protein